jgi:2-polyprenyl-3-methyl-5-hydroxy-6-metoxy-1,4-benzoquinol methylase
MNRKCQLCNGSEFHKLMDVEEANFSARIAAFDIYRCNTCDLAVMHPFPTLEDIKQLYIQNNVFSQPFNNPYQESLLFPILEPIYRKYGVDCHFIAQTCLKLAERAETLLDIGCSTGEQLSHFLELSPRIEAVGIDIDHQAKERAGDTIKRRIIIDDFARCKFNQNFDIITLKFVIEHLIDFQPCIEKIADLLSPNGIFFLSTPDIDSPKARQLKADWPLINDPYNKIGHLRWFNRESLYRLVDAFGFKVLKIVNRGELLHHLPRQLQSMLIRLFGKDETGRRFIKYYAPRVTYALIFDAWLSQTIGYGDCLYVFMTKKNHCEEQSTASSFFR